MIGKAESNNANGNLISDGTVSYLWNSRNQRQEIRQGISTGPLLTRYRYDVEGKQTGKTQGSTITGYLYDGWNIV